MSVVDFIKQTILQWIAITVVMSLGAFYAGIACFTLLLKRLRYGSEILTVKERSLPPLCLQDAAYGRHAFVRLKVCTTKFHRIVLGTHNFNQILSS